MGIFRKKSISHSYKEAKGFRKKLKYWEGHEDEVFYDPMYDFRRKKPAKKKSWWRRKNE